MQSRITSKPVGLVVFIAAVAMSVSSCAQEKTNADQTNAVILELLDHIPRITWTMDVGMRSAETRRFTISVQGLSRDDEVTSPPVVKIFHQGAEFQTIAYTGDAAGIRDSMLTDQLGNRTRLYTFMWTAPAAGYYEFWILAGTNHLAKTTSTSNGEDVKLGALTFSRDEIDAALASDPAYSDFPLELLMQRSENLEPAKFLVTVME